MNKSDSQFRWLIVAAAIAVLGVSYWMLGAKDRDREAAVALLQTVREEHGPRIERLKEAKKALVGLSATDPAVEQWMREANAAIAISEDVAACLERLRAHALPETAAEKVEGRRRFRYEDEDCAYLDRTLVEVLSGVDRFSRDEIQGLRQAHLDAVLQAAWANALRRAGLAPAAGCATDTVTGLPKRVVHAKTGIEMVLIPAGEFTMGSPANEVGRNDDEKQHPRVIRKPFYMGVTEVTQSQWQKVMGDNPSNFKGDGMPVECVSWEDCQKFVQKVGDGMRLPSEAEWEYACRAGSSSPFSFGANITPQQVNYDGEHPYNGAAKGLDRERTVPVGSLPANAWGMHEMHGNVWEWCQDVYAAYPDRGTEAPNSDSGPYRVGRGGSWNISADDCRSAYRYFSVA
jgi:formylglycine-generating enzyme required for sulfatase activity